MSTACASPKAALLSLTSWHLYTDAVARREEGLEGARHAPMLLLFEESNKIIAGVDSGASDGPRIQSDIIPSMFRDAGKYLIYLGIVVQSPSELPPGIISSPGSSTGCSAGSSSSSWGWPGTWRRRSRCCSSR